MRILEDILPTVPPTKSEGKEGRESPEGPAKSVSAAELFHEAVTQSPEIMGQLSIVSRTVKAESHYFHQESLVLARSRRLGLTIFDFDYRFGHDLVADFCLHPAVGAALVMLFATTRSSQSLGHRDVSFLLALWKSLIASTLTVHYHSRSTVLRASSLIDAVDRPIPGLHWIGPLKDAGLHNLFCPKDQCERMLETIALQKGTSKSYITLIAAEGRIETVEKILREKNELVKPILEGLLLRGDAGATGRILRIAKTFTSVDWKALFEQVLEHYQSFSLTNAGTAKNLERFITLMKDVGVGLNRQQLAALAKYSCGSVRESLLTFGAPTTTGFPFSAEQLQQLSTADATVDCNPTLMNNPVWERAFHHGLTAYELRTIVESATPEYIALRSFLLSDQILMNSPQYVPTALSDKAFYSPQRFGATVTTLPDGRRVMIAGEHEDSYDPDFFIYSEVVVIPPGCGHEWLTEAYGDGGGDDDDNADDSESEEEEKEEEDDDEDNVDDCDGEDAGEEGDEADEEEAESAEEDGEVTENDSTGIEPTTETVDKPPVVEWNPIEAPLRIYRYPLSVFPPTDGHSSVFLPKGHERVVDQILILGCLGYAPGWLHGNRQAGVTPVYMLNCESWAIERLPTNGGPGWFCHARRSTYNETSNCVTLTFSFKCSKLWTAEQKLVPLQGTATLDLHTLTWSIEVQSKARI